MDSLPLSPHLPLYGYVRMCVYVCKYTYSGLYYMMWGEDSFITEKVYLILKQNGVVN